ncbi:MAG: hypothetical protein II690_05865 [Ruminococcus sp.]|nr:hypothetical protein [Ruminococcus sp.]
MKHITIIEDDIGLNNDIAIALKREDITFFQLYRLGDFQSSEPTDLIILEATPAKFDEKTCMNPYVDRF